MRRREFLVGASVASISCIAGCSGLTGPDMEFQSFVVPDPTVVSVDKNDNEYFATIQNNRDGGNIRAELWYFQDSEVSGPSAAAMYQTDSNLERHFDLARTRYFDADERRKISITGTESPPIQSETREFGMFPWPASHGAVYRNTGSSGEIEFRFEYRNTRGYNTEEPSTKLETVGSDETIEVVFNTVTPPRAEYEIIAEPV